MYIKYPIHRVVYTMYRPNNLIEAYNFNFTDIGKPTSNGCHMYRHMYRIECGHYSFNNGHCNCNMYGDLYL